MLAITDSPASPLSCIARHVLFAPADHPVLTSSSIAVLALIEGLVAGVMARNKEAVKLATELTESVMSYLHIPVGSKLPKKVKFVRAGCIGLWAGDQATIVCGV